MDKIILSNRIKIKDPSLSKELKKAFTILNPAFTQACAKRRLKFNEWPKSYIVVAYKNEQGFWRSKKEPRYISFWKEQKGSLTFPRGCFWQIRKVYKACKRKYKLIDKRQLKPKTSFKFHGELDPDRDQNRIKELLNYKTGIFKAPTGSGKTAMFIWLTAHIQQPAIILVDTERLLKQWIEQIKTFFKLSENEIGIVGGGKTKIKPITVALIQSLCRKPELLNHFGLMGVDECPSVATETYGICVDNFFGMYLYGLSATPKRSDGKTVVMKWYLGEIKTIIQYKDAKRTPGKITFISTNFISRVSFRQNNVKAMTDITIDKDRNKLIVKTMKSQKDFPGAHIALSHRIDHMETIINLLPKEMKKKAVKLTAKLKEDERQEIIEGIKTGKYKYLFATHKMLGRGFDEGTLSILYLLTPFKDEVGLKQYVGRVSRLHPEKEYFMVFDFFDRYSDELKNYTQVRSKVYAQLGLKKTTIK